VYFDIDMDQIIYVLLMTVFVVNVQGYNLTDFQTLHTDLFTSHKKSVMPMESQWKPLTVGIKFYLNSITSFKEVDDTMSLLVSSILIWNDPSLSWNPGSYAGIDTTSVPSENIWIPPIFVVNRVDKMEGLGSKTSFYTSISYTGDVYYSPGDVIDITCPTDISKFPFDTQRCVVYVFAWGTNTNTLNFTSIEANAKLDYFSPNSDWTLQEHSTNVEEWHSQSVFKVTLQVKRQPLYYTVMVVTPTLLFAVLNPLVFLLPVESGERVGFSVTILLSYAIFLTLVSSSVPATSNPMCVLLIIMVIIIIISGIIVFGTIRISNYYHTENIEEISSSLKRFTQWRFKRKSNVVLNVSKKNETEITGRDIANILDSILFYGSYVVIFTISFAYILYVIIS
jgi:hypothetical protein